MDKKKQFAENIKSVSFVGTTRLFQIENWENMVLVDDMYIFIVDSEEVKFKKSQILITYR